MVLEFSTGVDPEGVETKDVEPTDRVLFRQISLHSLLAFLSRILSYRPL